MVLLVLDLGVFHRRAHVVSLREAAIFYVFWLSLAALFNVGIYAWLGSEKGTEFLTGYVIEVLLSVDNVFVWLIVFAYFAVPAQFQHRVLFLGIVGAVVMRGVFIATGVTLLNQFEWVIYVFGAFLVFTGIRLALRNEEEVHPERNPVLRLARRFLPITSEYREQHFFVLEQGKRLVTPLFLVLLVVETTDVVFAMDSVPAILSITTDPFIVWTSNVFAILGLRALFFLVAGTLRYFRHLKIGLSLVLVFVGVKMLISEVYHLPTVISLGAVVGILAVTMLISYLITRREGDSPTAEMRIAASSSDANGSESEDLGRGRG